MTTIMESLGKKSSAYIAYMIINFIWYFSLAIFAIIAIILGISYWNPALIDFNIALPIDPSAVAMAPELPFLEIDEVKGTMEISYMIENRPGFYLGWTCYILGISALFLFGFNNLRLVLKSAVYEAVFNSENISRLKKLAFAVMAFDPLSWIYHILLLSQLGFFVEGYGIEIGMISFKIGYLLTGLLLYVLATIFEKGNLMYQELKLTI